MFGGLEIAERLLQRLLHTVADMADMHAVCMITCVCVCVHAQEDQAAGSWAKAQTL